MEESKKTGISLKAIQAKESLKLSALKEKLLLNVKGFTAGIKLKNVNQNFWFWNLIFINISIITVLFYTVYKHLPNVRPDIGINLDNVRNYDTVVPQDFLYYILYGHLFFILVTILFAFRAGKRLNHLFIIASINLLLFGLFEFFALRDLLLYFQN
jgi:hypothetical protein